MATYPRTIQRTCTRSTDHVYPDGSHVVTASSYAFSASGLLLPARNPLYRDQILRHVDASTGYRREECLEATPAYHSHTIVAPVARQGNHVVHQKSSWLSITSAGVDDVALRDRALAILKRRLASSTASFSSMAPLAELRELRGLIRGLASTASLRAIRRYAAERARLDLRYPLTGSVGKVNRHTAERRKYLSSAWLQINFGLKPMLSDVADAAQAVAARLEGFPPTTRLTAFASKDWVTGGSYIVDSVGSFSRTRHSVATRHTLSYMYTAGVAPKVLSGCNYGVADQFGFVWREVPGVLWELQPYSWMADYFANVGSYLSDTFECPPGYCTYLTLSKKYTCDTQELPCAEIPTPGTAYIAGDYSSPGRYRYLSFSREKLSSLPHIGLRFKTTDEVGSYAVTKLLNLLSVYLQRK